MRRARLAAPPAPDPAGFVDRAAASIGSRRESLIPLLQAVQRELRFVPDAALERIASVLSISPAEVEGVASFYAQFRRKPVGRHVISLCHGTACHVKGAALVDDALCRHLGLTEGQDTDSDGLFTVERVACLGCCTLAPVMQIDGTTYGRLEPATAHRCLTDFLAFSRSGGTARREGERAEGRKGGGSELRITVDSCCAAAGAVDLAESLARSLGEAGAHGVVKPVGCHGMCHRVPTVEVVQPGRAPVHYESIGPDRAEGVVQRHFHPRGPVGYVKRVWSAGLDRMLAGESEPPISRYTLDIRDGAVCSFLGPQKRIATEFCGSMDPLDLDEYRAHEGFAALERVVQSSDSAAVVQTVTESGLRGRGGAGFPTGRKWATVRAAAGEPKYLVCNGDEGDPGAFMDRMLLESFPYRVLEGMMIAAFAVGAAEGILYVRAEYPHALRRVREAIRRMESAGLLGAPLFGADFTFHLRVVEGAGAFVCGEETALIASIEGRRGEPRPRPPYPAESGLWGSPTCINNVETYSLVPWIVRNGAEEFAALGTERSKGTKVFALAGEVRRGGLVEVPMGVTIRQIVQDIGGGVPDGREFKAVQVGGPSGGCVPAALADTPVDYEALASVGAIMGSGGMVVLDDRTCMVDVARYFLSFTQTESCGKCTMCRLGTRRILDVLERICEGHGRQGDLEKLDDLAAQVKAGSMCGLGQTAPNPVLSTLRHFRNEYEAHLAGRCPARRCKALIHYQVLDNCNGCTLCAQVCPTGAIALRPFAKHEVDDSLCTRCDSCRVACPIDAICVN